MSVWFQYLKIDLIIRKEPVSIVLSIKIQQLAVPSKEFRENMDTAMYQSCSEIGSQGPSVGTLVPPDSEIHVVAFQKLIERIIFSHSVRYKAM